MDEDEVNLMAQPHLRDKVLMDAVTEMLLFIRQEREENPTLPDIKQVMVQKEDRDITASWNQDSWVVYAILTTGRTYKYAWYIGPDGQIVADGF